MQSFLRLALAASVLFSSAGLAKENGKAPPCSTPEFRQLDFWVGTWELSWTGQDGKPGKGTNVITRSLNDCVIEERFAVLDGERPFTGMSVSTYDVKARGWRQTWVDNSGAYIPLAGGPSEEGFQFRQRNYADDRNMRMIWKDVKKDSLDWHWQRSEDGGQTWEDVWVIHYKRAE
jgi:hypothetical protein